jgi:Ca2+-binding RTX toxin-like protein
LKFSINGNAENDIIEGYSGNDQVYGNDGNNVLTGGPGSDQFNCGAGIDTITDFQPGFDTKSANCVHPIWYLMRVPHPHKKILSPS